VSERASRHLSALYSYVIRSADLL